MRANDASESVMLKDEKAGRENQDDGERNNAGELLGTTPQKNGTTNTRLKA
jgi:hypothetical protein